MERGDIVELNCGGGSMSVSEADDGAIAGDGDGIVQCEWFNANKDLCKASFYVCQLISVTV